MNSHRIILSTGMLILVVVAGVCAAEIPPMPCEFYGNVIINGQPAPAGTIIEAKINGQPAGSLTTTTVGTYGGAGVFDARLVVNGFARGDTITFFVNGSISNQSAVFLDGSAQSLDLTMYNGMEPVAEVTQTTMVNATATATQTGTAGSSGYTLFEAGTVEPTPVTPVSSSPTPTIPAELPAPAATATSAQPVVTTLQELTQEQVQMPVNSPATPVPTTPATKPTQSPGLTVTLCCIGLAIACGLKVAYR
jgi:hypothetical protein